MPMYLPTPTVDAHVPDRHRVLDYLLGGKDNFAVDRNLAKCLSDQSPPPTMIARAERNFCRRTITYVAGKGVSQYLDLAPVLPESGSVAKQARAVHPAAHVVYAGREQVTLAHLRSLEDHPLTRIYNADVRRPEKLLQRALHDGTLNFSAPICVVLSAVWASLGASDIPGILCTLRDHLAPGSRLIIATAELPGAEPYLDLLGPAMPMSELFRDIVESGWFLTFPGVRSVTHWRPEITETHGVPLIGGVGFLPG